MNTRRTAHLARHGFFSLAAAIAWLPAGNSRLAAQAVPFLVPLDQMVVTATRTPTPADQVGSSVSVVSGETLAREQIDTLSGALGDVAGVALAPNGAPGAATSLFLRGANSN
jgi:vitamin B12 transporter